MTDTELLDYLEAHPRAFFVTGEGDPGVSLCEKDGHGEMGLGSGPTVRDAIADAITAERRVRHCKAVGCTNEVAFAGYCSTACFLDPNGEGY